MFPPALRNAGHTVTTVAVGDPDGALASALRHSDALVIAGGDGTVHRAARDAINAAVPIYHIPCGNENLFARQFGMDRKIHTLLRALAAPRVVRIDAATVEDANAPADGHVPPLSLLMCSVGPDAGVIQRLTALRTRAIGHFAYIEPIVRECVRPSFPPLTVDLDGRRILENARGTLIVANSRQYALRIDPARRADMSDGLLDVVFLPGRGALSALLWAIRCRWRRDIDRCGALYLTGTDVRIQSPEPGPYQIDGDSPGWCGADRDTLSPGSRPLSLHIALLPAALPVLTPPPRP